MKSPPDEPAVGPQMKAAAMDYTSGLIGTAEKRLLLFWVIAFSTGGTLAGCKSGRPVELGPPPSRYQANALSTLHVRRVVMLPLANMTPYEHVSHEFDKLLAAELRTKGAFELITISHADFGGEALKLTRKGLYDDELLASVGRKYQADAVVVGKISHFHPYWPPSLSVSLHCLDTREGTVLSSVDGSWDARNKFIANQAEKFYGHLHAQDRLPHSELVLNSPSYFQKFVAYQIAERLLTPSQRSRDPSPAITE